MTTETKFESLDAFYGARQGSFSGECDFGVHWYSAESADGQRRGPFFRVSVVHDTGDVYAFHQWAQTVELLTSLPANTADCKPLRHGRDCCYTLAEQIFAGWAEGGSKPLQWVRDRIAGMWANADAIVQQLADEHDAQYDDWR